MDHVISEWKEADPQVVGTYRHVMRMVLVACVGLVILLGLMALTLL